MTAGLVFLSAAAIIGFSSFLLRTFTSAPAAGKVLTWSGSFYRRVRLTSDEHEAERIVYQIWETKSLELISVK